MASRDCFEQANQRAEDLEARIPRALSARYDHKTGRIVIHLSSKLIVSFSPGDVEGLKDARPSQLDKIEISPSGFGTKESNGSSPPGPSREFKRNTLTGSASSSAV